MRKILTSIMVIGIAATLLGAGTLSYFSDWEISTDNIMQAGEIDLKIDCNSTWWRGFTAPGDTGPTLMGEINFPERDLTIEKLFNWTDIKPGDWGELTLSYHLYSNPGWLWLHVNNTMDYENGFTEPEGRIDITPNMGELSQYIYTFLWLDEGMIPGFQGKDVDPDEGDNEFDEWGPNEHEPILYGTPYQEDLTMHDFLIPYDCCWQGPMYIENCTTYYIGWYWWVPTWVGNIIQGDSFEFDLEFFVEQVANNPDPVPPGDPCDGEADLEIFKTVDNPRPYYGDLITFNVTVHNKGPSTSSGIVVYDLLPGGLTYDDHWASQGTYDEVTGDWNVGSLGECNYAYLEIDAIVDPTEMQFTQLAMIIDGSGSIDSVEFELMVDGLAAAIRDPSCFPRTGKVELTVVQFGVGASYNCAQVELPPTVITAVNYDAIATIIETIVQGNGNTPMAAGIYLAADQMYYNNSYGDFNASYRQVLNLVTDGTPNVCCAPPFPEFYHGPYCGSNCATTSGKISAEAARNYTLDLLGMRTDPQDEFDAEGVKSYGSGPPDIAWLRDYMVYPEPGYEWVPPDPPAGPGWVRYVESWDEFADSICEKLQFLLGLTNIAEIIDSNPVDQNTSDNIAWVTVFPQEDNPP